MFKTDLMIVCDQTWKWLHTGELRTTFLIQHRLEERLAFKVGVVHYKPEKSPFQQLLMGLFISFFSIGNRLPQLWKQGIYAQMLAVVKSVWEKHNDFWISTNFTQYGAIRLTAMKPRHVSYVPHCCPIWKQ